MMRLLAFVFAALAVYGAEDTSSVDDQDYFVDDDQMYYDKNQTADDKGEAYKVQETAPTATETNEKPPPNCLKDCKGFPQGADSFSAQLQCEFVLGVKEGDGCANDCTDQEFEEQFATMREFCSDTADSWDGECVADCPGAPGSKEHPNAFADDMSDNDVCSFLLPLKSGDKCLEDCKEDDFTAINSIRDQCAQERESPEEQEPEDEEPVEHVSAVTSAVLVGGFSMDEFLETFLGRRRKLEDTTPTTSAESGCASEPHWCETNLPRSENGMVHENCRSWAKDCPCTCASPQQEAAQAAFEDAPGDAQAQIARQHEIEAQEAEQQGPQGGEGEGEAPKEHRAEEAFVSAMAHTLLVKRNEVDILNIINRDIQVINEQDGSVRSTTPGIEIEFGVRFVEGAEEEQRLVAEKLRSMNLGCMYMFSGRLRCDADAQKQLQRERDENRGGSEKGARQQGPANREHGARRLKESQVRGQEQSEDPEHTAVAHLEMNGGNGQGGGDEIDLMVEFRWAFSTELRNSGVKVPDDFSIVAVEQPRVVLFGPNQEGENGQQQTMSYYQNPQGFGPPVGKKGLSPGATAGVVLLILGAAVVAAVAVFMKLHGQKVGRFNAKEEYGMQERFDAAKSATSSLSPKMYNYGEDRDRSGPISALDDENDDEEVVDLEQVDSI